MTNELRTPFFERLFDEMEDSIPVAFFIIASASVFLVGLMTGLVLLIDDYPLAALGVIVGLWLFGAVAVYRRISR